VLAAGAVLLIVGWAAGSTDFWQRPSAAPLVLWVVTAALVAAWLWRVLGRLLVWDRPSAAAEIERHLELPLGSVRGAVEPGVQRPGTSRALVDLHRSRVARELRGHGVRDLGDARARAARSYAFGAVAAALFAVGGLAVVWSVARDSAPSAWAAVLHPVRHLAAPALPDLQIRADADHVRRGRDLPVSIEAPQRDSVRLVWQPRGELAAGRWYEVSGGSTAALVPRVETPTLVWAAADDGAVSDTLSVHPVDPLLLLDVRVSLRFPGHTQREREVISAPLPLMSVPEGTWATVTGTTTRPLASVALRSSAGREIPFEISGQRRFERSFTVRPGAWGWDIVGAEGEPLEGLPDSLQFLTVPDSAPLVEVVYPGVDTILSTEMVQPLMIELRDDYGLSLVELVSWRVSAWGERWPDVIEDVELNGDAPRAILQATIDARGRGFLPGDTLHYFVRAYDNAPEPQEGRSREYVLRLPTLDEVRDRAISEAENLVESTEQLAEQARRHQEETQALERSTESTPAPGAELRQESPAGDVEFRETEAARRALEEATRLLESSRQIQEQLRELQQSIENAGLNDSTLLERLREIQSLYERILTPELEQQIEGLREALRELDEDQIREAIRRLAEGSVDFRERVEQTVELLRRAALEQEFGTLEARAEELSQAQEQLAESVSEAANADSLDPQLERRAEDLARRAEELSQQVGEFSRELSEAGEQQASEKAEEAESASAEAARSDRETAQSMAESRQQQASRSSRQAASQMRQAASALQQGRQQMQENWRQEVVQALERAQAEALELARRQDELNERMQSSDTGERAASRSEEVALKRGLDEIKDRLENAASSSLLMSPTVLENLGQASEGMQQLLDQMSDGTRRSAPSPELAQQITESLNELSYQLMQAADAAQSARSGTGMEEAMEQLAQLAQQQGQLNSQSGGMTPGAMTDAMLQMLQQLAGNQRQIAEELERLNRTLGPRGQVLGQLDELSSEAEELARQMERGRIDQQIVERQNRLYNRLLDAGRTLEQDEFERERRAERPGAVQILRPGELPPELLQGPRFPHPGSEALNRYPPALRRLILEYFDRLNQGEGGGGS
jgi:hypothetical protein